MSTEQVATILHNALDNALRFAPESTPIQVHVNLQGDKAIVSIRDFGPGIAPEDRERVFERLYRPDQSRNRDFGGSGIGLSVVKKIVELRQGQVHFEPANPGAKLIIQLPATGITS